MGNRSEAEQKPAEAQRQNPGAVAHHPPPVARPYELILRKRDGGRLSAGEIGALISAYTRGEIPDYQMSALLMAIFFRGMDDEELAAWTDAMLRSGEILDLSELPGVKVDKHSTGGVGDKVSLPLAPLCAAVGVYVPMVSGRGLGHTGGTLDKLESIPGFRTDLSVARFREILREHKTCLIGQTAEIAPADKKLYALRDVTGTVESIPLIVSSIMSKKLAEGIDALVLDVKVGRGAFMRRREDARKLAEMMIATGARMKTRVVAYLTAMDQPLGRAVGNSVEVVESIEVLKGGGPRDLADLTLELAAEMAALAGRAPDIAAGRALCREALASGAALRAFAGVIAAQGGDPRVIDEPARLPLAPVRSQIFAPRSGFISEVDALEVGLAAVEMGAGRAKKEDAVDPGVGILLEKKRGDRVEAGEPLATLYTRGPAEALSARIRAAFAVSEEPAPERPLILERLTGA
jgi:pyrimidine-nucleoside phosphorylase/thymidine phosphorylase